VVVVTVTYQLGISGFFGDRSDPPGNLGLLDQHGATRAAGGGEVGQVGTTAWE
jgi:hypothetical protein